MYWFPIGWIKPALNSIQIKTSLPPCLSRKVALVIQTRTKELKRFHVRRLYNYFDNLAKPHQVDSHRFHGKIDSQGRQNTPPDHRRHTLLVL